MKALADLKRRQMSTNLAAPLLPDEDFDYQPRSLGKPARHGLRAVSPQEMPILSDSMEVDQDEFDRTTRDSQRMVSNISTNMVMRPTFTNRVKATTITTPKLTTDEFIQVRLATVRESTRHCYWPSDVVARFAAADVIR